MIKIRSFIMGTAVGSLVLYLVTRKKNKKSDDKFKIYYNILVNYIEGKQSGREVSQQLINAGYNKVAIYGLGHLGTILYKDLSASNVTVAFFIDKNSVKNGTTEVDCKSIDAIGDCHDIDAIIITPVSQFNEIKNELQNKVNCDIISLEDIV